VGIDAAVRAAQAHREAPALAGAKRRRLLRLLPGGIAVPGKNDAPRHAGLGRLEVEIEA